MRKHQPRIGYVPYDLSLRKPGDRRRFVSYAKARNLQFEIADPTKKYDLVVLSEVADISQWCDYPHGKVVFDFIDSYLTIPKTNVKQWLRGIVFFMVGRHQRFRFNYWSVLQDMCQRADAVICTTQEQKNSIQKYCKNTHIIHDVHSSVVRKVKESYTSSQPFELVWEGLPSNITQLKQIRDVLFEVNKKTDIVLNVITDPEWSRILGRFGKVETIKLIKNIFPMAKFHVWDELTCSDIIRSCDLAIIPIDLSDEFVTGKPENKLLLLWRMGMPVIVSATPAYLGAMKEVGFNELACKNKQEWLAAMEMMISDKSIRENAGKRGKDFAEENFGENILLNRWDKLFSSIGYVFNESDA